MILDFFNLFIILGILLAFMLWIKKIVNKKNIALSRKSKYIQVIDDGLSMGIGHKLSIIKVNDEYFLFSHGQNVSSFQKLNNFTLEEMEEKWSNEFAKNNKTPYGVKNFLSKERNKQNGGKSDS